MLPRRRSGSTPLFHGFIVASAITVFIASYRQLTMGFLKSVPDAGDDVLPGHPNKLFKSLAKLRQQVGETQIANWDRSRPIYIDLGLSDAKDTELFLSKGYSTLSVDAYLPWIETARTKFAAEIASHRALFFNVGLGLDDEDEPMPLYFKTAGSVIASFVREKGCQGAVYTKKCQHVDVPVVQCDAILTLANVQAEIFKVDIEMLHHSCIRSLHRLDTDLLPKYVCWEEHDKPFGEDKSKRPITDTKLILGLHELGYDGIKLVMQGPWSAKFYGLEKGQAGHGQGSGTLTPEEMMHYRSYEDNEGQKFDTAWRTVERVLQQGVFAPGNDKKPQTFTGKAYFDICMKLSPEAARLRELRTKQRNFSLGSYAELKRES